ncbi:MAG: hypothetical protein ACMXYG_05610 [Candidatus Woesearchaeota archaeon]
MINLENNQIAKLESKLNLMWVGNTNPQDFNESPLFLWIHPLFSWPCLVNYYGIKKDGKDAATLLDETIQKTLVTTDRFLMKAGTIYDIVREIYLVKNLPDNVVFNIPKATIDYLSLIDHERDGYFFASQSDTRGNIIYNPSLLRSRIRLYDPNVNLDESSNNYLRQSDRLIKILQNTSAVNVLGSYSSQCVLAAVLDLASMSFNINIYSNFCFERGSSECCFTFYKNKDENTLKEILNASLGLDLSSKVEFLTEECQSLFSSDYWINPSDNIKPNIVKEPDIKKAFK